MIVRRGAPTVTGPPWLLLCAGLAALAGMGAAVNAGRLALVLLGALAAVAVALRPWLAVVVVLAADALALVLVLAAVDTAALDIGAFGLTAVAFLSSRVRSSRPLPSTVRLLIASVGLVLGCGLVVASSGGIPLSQSTAGLRLFAAPVMCALIGLTFTGREASRLLRVATLFAVASAVAALVEQSLGAGALESAGLTYGVSVRHFEGELRAPGLFATNYSLGAFAGVLGGLAVAWWPAVQTGADKVWRATAVVASCACLLLSIYRTGIVVLVVSVALWLLVVERRGTLGRRLLTMTAGIVAVGYVLSSGLGSTGSLLERGQVWRGILRTFGLPLLGHGLGFSGAASGSRFSARTVVVDNYYLSLLLQYGVLAVGVVGPLVLLTLTMVRLSRRSPALRSGVVLAACLVAFVFVDFWEYTAAMALTMTAVAAGYARHLAVPPADRGEDGGGASGPAHVQRADPPGSARGSQEPLSTSSKKST